MKRIEHIRTVIAVLLLSVALPMTLVVPFHHHETEESALVSCDRCVNHQPHPGHLAAASQMDNCLVCQFLGVTYLPEECADAPFGPDNNTEYVDAPSASVHSVQVQSLSTRAPPYSFC